MPFPIFRIAILFTGVLAAQPRLDWVTQIGGSGADTAAAIARDPQGNFYVAGSTLSNDLPANGLQKRSASPGLARADNLQSARPVQVPAAPSSVIADSARAGVLYLLTNQGSYRSTDFGETWTPLHPPLHLSRLAARGDLLVGYSFTAAGTDFLLRSTDAGATWQTVASISGRDGIAQGLVLDAATSTIIAWTSTAIYRSEDAGATWLRQNGALRLITFDPAHPGRVWALSGPATVARSDDRGLTWRDVYTDPAQDPISALTVDSQGAVFIASPFRWIARGVDGANFSRQNFVGQVFQFLADPDSAVVYANSGERVVASSDAFASSVAIKGAGNGAIGLAISAGRLFVATQPRTEAFVAKLDPRGQLTWLTYLGGAGNDQATCIAVDADGNAYVGGSTNSDDFPGAFRGRVYGVSAFAVKVSSDGQSLAWGNVWSDFSGGKLPLIETAARAIAVDAAGRVSLAAVSVASAGGFIAGPPIRFDYGFLVRLDAAGEPSAVSEFGTASLVAVAASADGSVWAASTFRIFHVPFGGAPREIATLPSSFTLAAMALDARGVWVAGTAYPGDIQTTPGAFRSPRGPTQYPGDQVFAGQRQAVLLRVDRDSGAIGYAGIVGGEVLDRATGLAIDPNGAPVLGGITGSKGFPTRYPSQGPYNSNTSFVARLRPDGGDLDYSTFVGDLRQFSVVGVALDLAGNPVVLGHTQPISSTQGDDVFVAQYVLDGRPEPRLDSVVNTASNLATPLAPGARLTLRGAGFGEAPRVYLSGIEVPTESASTNEIALRLPDLLAGDDRRITVEAAGAVSNPVLMPVDRFAPGIYTVDRSGRGQALVFNQDGSSNSIENPAAPGSVVRIAINGANREQPLFTHIGGLPARIVNAGAATLDGIGEVFEIQAQVPDVPLARMAPLSVALNVTEGATRAQGGVSIAVGIRP